MRIKTKQKIYVYFFIYVIFYLTVSCMLRIVGVRSAVLQSMIIEST